MTRGSRQSGRWLRNIRLNGQRGGTFTDTALPVATLTARLRGATESLKKARHGRLPDDLQLRFTIKDEGSS